MPAKQAIFPSSQRRGGCAERGEGADGVARSANPIGRSLNEDRRNISAELTTPARLLLRLRPIGLALRATPPLQRRGIAAYTLNGKSTITAGKTFSLLTTSTSLPGA